MATSTRHLCRALIQVSRQTPLKRKCHRAQLVTHQVPFRSLSGSRICHADSPTTPQASGPASSRTASDDLADEPDPTEYLTPTKPITVHDLDPEARADYEVLSKAEQSKYLALQNHYRAIFESAEGDAVLDRLVDQIDRELDREEGPLDFPTPRVRPQEVGFWADDEEDEFAAQVEDADDDWQPEHITSVAESELEVHREIREYYRVIAWDMPLLKQFAKPFHPPDDTTPLRFRYTTYMGEVHPAAKKVVVEFCTKDLKGLTEQQRVKLIKLVGPRYNPDQDMVKISCEKFEAPAQNKRYLGDLVNRLIAEAKDSSDLFEDIPLDFRHHKPKRKVAYPEEWKLKPQRVEALVTARQEAKLLEDGAHPLNGKQVVESYVHSMSTVVPRTPLRSLR